MTAPEFSRRVPLDQIGEGGRDVAIEADAPEREALAARFGLLSLVRLAARTRLTMRAGIVHAEGRLEGEAEQPCVVTGDPVPARIDEAFRLRFTDQDGASEEEVELSEEDCDTLPLDAGAVDLGEAVAESFALALPPFPRCAAADAALRDAGVLSEADAAAERNPFAALKDRLGG